LTSLSNYFLCGWAANTYGFIVLLNCGVFGAMEDYLRWMEQADEDYKTAKLLINQGVYYASVFFSHQAIEKALESILLRHGKDLGKIHSLPELADMLELETGINIPENIRSAINEVNPHYVITRYPDAANGVPARAYNKVKAQEILDKCGVVLEWSRLNLH